MLIGAACGSLVGVPLVLSVLVLSCWCCPLCFRVIVFRFPCAVRLEEFLSDFSFPALVGGLYVVCVDSLFLRLFALYLSFLCCVLVVRYPLFAFLGLVWFVDGGSVFDVPCGCVDHW